MAMLKRVLLAMAVLILSVWLVYEEPVLVTSKYNGWNIVLSPSIGFPLWAERWNLNWGQWNGEVMTMGKRCHDRLPWVIGKRPLSICLAIETNGWNITYNQSRAQKLAFQRHPLFKGDQLQVIPWKGSEVGLEKFISAITTSDRSIFFQTPSSPRMSGDTKLQVTWIADSQSPSIRSHFLDWPFDADSKWSGTLKQFAPLYPAESDPVLRRHLLPTSLIILDDPIIEEWRTKTSQLSPKDIPKAARKFLDVHVLNDSDNPWESAEKDWTYTSSDVLQGKPTRCYGYALAACALFRAFKIPARVVAGWACDDDRQMGHVWTEYHDDHRWIVFDRQPFHLIPLVDCDLDHGPDGVLHALRELARLRLADHIEVLSAP